MDDLEEKMKALMPESAGRWDPTLPLPVNIARMTQGEDAFSDQQLQAIRDDIAGIQPQRNMLGPSLPEEASSSIRSDDTTAHETYHKGKHTAYNGHGSSDYHDIVQAMSSPGRDESESPLHALQRQVASVFMHGPRRAGGVFQELSMAAEYGTTVADTPIADLAIPWNSCKAAATLVMLLACPKEKMYDALKFQSQRLGGLPTLPMIRNTPRVSLQQAFRSAKERARGKDASTTVMAASLIDVHIFELAEQGRSQPYQSFAHTFVVGIGPEGVVIWQGWGEHGYGLDEYIQRDGARVRTWQEAGDFVDRFEKMTLHKGRWDAKRNKLYKQCFGIDINTICGPNGPSRPIVPKFETWVRLLEFENVKLEHIHKFTFN